MKFFERARTEWLRALGLQQQALRDATELIFVVTQTHVRYKAPARLDDLLQISVELTRCGGASMAFAQQARCGPLLLAEGQIDVACVDGVSFKPRRLPKEFAPLLLQPKAL